MEPKDSPIEKDKEDLLQTINRLQQGAVLRDMTETQSVKFPGKDEHTTIVVLGASGDLAKKMTFPALFSLHCLNMLPENCHIVGFARSKLSTEEFQKKALEETKGEDDQKKSFAKLLFYVAGQYDSKQDFEKLNEEIEKWEKNLTGNRIFYLAIPPSVFTAAASSAAAIKSKTGWTRIVVEKPFGRDLKTSEELCSDLARFFDEQQIFRIDHYLGKEMVQNLMALRFANVIWDPVWNNNYISCVMISFKEDFGTQGRGGYFENYGIIRDVMQNHMLQMLALVAMEPPVTLSPEDVRDEKVKVLRACDKIDTEEVVIGQYTADKEGKEKGYKEEEGVPKDSITPTFSTAVLHINNRRWKGVPFILRCGKGLNEKKTEIRIQFKKNLFALFPESARNELVIRVNPDEAIYMKFNAKVPGLSEDLVETELDLTYKSRFETRIPGAYERLIYDIIRGDRNLFVRVDELQAAWNIFTPMLHHLEKNKVKPEEYSFGTRGPESSDRLLAKCGFEKGEGYQWPTTTLDNNLAPSKDSKSATK